MKKSERDGELSMTKQVFHSKGGKLVRPDNKCNGRFRLCLRILNDALSSFYNSQKTE